MYNVYAENNLSFEEAEKKYPNFMVKDKTKPETREWKTRAGYMPDVINGHKYYTSKVWRFMSQAFRGRLH